MFIRKWCRLCKVEDLETEIVHKEIDEEKKIFRMYTDITYLSADGDGNTEYNIDGTTASVNPDNPQILPYHQ